jgi:hypothetical protein
VPSLGVSWSQWPFWGLVNLSPGNIDGNALTTWTSLC